LIRGAHGQKGSDRKDVPWVVFIEVGPVVVGTTSETTTTWMLPVLSYTTVTCRNVAPVLAGLGESGRHLFDKPIACSGKAKRLNSV